ncbi:hypothetical protein [Roseiarcus sp.]|uniref:hypothetical protein n=1 Tax=Roseiarcus sp. TaxID=1969460 RepID=UPI003F9C5107
MTSAGHAHNYVVSSLAPEGAGPTDSTLYLVPPDAKGLSVAGPWDGLGIRANASSPMTLENCLVDPGHYRRDETGIAPAMQAQAQFRSDPHWRDLQLFYEYFHAETGQGLGACHHTGRTGLIANLLLRDDCEEAVSGRRRRLRRLKPRLRQTSDRSMMLDCLQPLPTQKFPRASVAGRSERNDTIRRRRISPYEVLYERPIRAPARVAFKPER